MAIPDAEDVHDYRPLFALDQNGTRAIATASQIDNLALSGHDRSGTHVGRLGSQLVHEVVVVRRIMMKQAKM
ncbi:MAG: hypothetical protein WCF50_09825, partial [Pseudolabrys sp.]